MHARTCTNAIVLLTTASLCFAQQDPLDEGIALYARGQYDEAARVLSEQLDKPGEGARSAQALYTLATIRSAQGRHADADSGMERLLADHAASLWSPYACMFLTQRASDRQDWARAGQLTAQFLDLYLALPYTAIDDPTSRDAFARLVACEKKKSPGAPDETMYRTLRERYPVSTAAGRVVALLAGVDPTDPDANLVLNPGFEWDARTVGTPAGWKCLGTEPDIQNDFDGAVETGGFMPAHTGRYCAGKFTSHGTHRGWFCQRVPVLPGQRYDVSVFGMTPAQEDRPGRLRLGVDVSGKTDPLDQKVRWTEAVSPVKEYQELAFRGPSAVVASGPYLTVFLELRQDIAAPYNAMVFDDASVRQAK